MQGLRQVEIGGSRKIGGGSDTGGGKVMVRSRLA